MKKILFILVMVISYGLFGQDNITRTNIVSFWGSFTTAERDLLDVPTDEVYMIYNSTTGQLEFARADDVWGPVGGGAADNLGSDVNRNLFTVSGGGSVATINNNVVTSASITNGTIQTEDIGTNQITTDLILNGAVNGPDLANDAVASGKIINNTIRAEDMQSTNSPTDGDVQVYDLATGGYVWTDSNTLGGAGISELADLSDVSLATQGNRNALLSNGTTFSSRPIVEADISNLAHTTNTDNQTATQVSIVDAGGFFTGTNVEAALQEIGTGGGAPGSDDQTASEVAYSNATSGLTANVVQTAIDEIEARVDINDAKGTNTDAQDLTLTGNTLAISGDPNTDVDLSGYLDNTDTQSASAVPVVDIGSYFVNSNVEQVLQEIGGQGFSDGQVVDTLDLVGTTLRLSIERDSVPLNTVDLSPLQDGIGTDDQTATEVSFSNVASGLTASNVQDAIDEVEARVDLNDVKVTNTDAQTLSFTSPNLSITGGNSVDISAIQDGTGTDDQTAAEVTIADAGAIITATDVEGALQENRTAIDNVESLIYGDELVTNGTFDTDTDWTKANTATISGGVGNLASPNDQLTTNGTVFTSENTYKITFTNTVTVRIYANNWTEQIGGFHGPGDNDIIYTPTTTGNLRIQHSGASAGTIDNVSVKKVVSVDVFVSKVGTPTDNQVGVWTGDGTLEGDPDFTFNGTDLTITGSLTTGGNTSGRSLAVQTGVIVSTEVQGTNNEGHLVDFRTTSAPDADGVYNGFRFYNNDVTYKGGVVSFEDTAGRDYLLFGNTYFNPSNAQMIIDIDNNRIGINKDQPTEALDVTGNIAATGTLALNGATSGTATITAPAVAGTPTLTLPTTTGTLALTSDITDDQTASEVPVTDTGLFYTATDVEGVLAEIAPQLGGSESTTVSDTAEIDLTLTGSDITADIIAGSIDETKLDVSTNASLDLADTALQSIGADAVGTPELDDDANTPTVGYVVVVETGGLSFDYVDPATFGDGIGTDNQNISGSGLAGNNLTIAIEDGASELVDLSKYDNLGPDGDKGDITVGGTGTTLEIDAGAVVEADLNASINASLDLADTALQSFTEVDGSVTNEIQTIDVASLIGTVLNLSLSSDGEINQTVELSSLQDGTGTDDQDLTLTGNTLAIESDPNTDVDLTPYVKLTQEEVSDYVGLLVNSADDGISYDDTNNDLDIEGQEIEGVYRSGIHEDYPSNITNGTINTTGTGYQHHTTPVTGTMPSGVTEAYFLNFKEDANNAIQLALGNNTINMRTYASGWGAWEDLAGGAGPYDTQEAFEDGVGGMVLNAGDGLDYDDTNGRLEVNFGELPIGNVDHGGTNDTFFVASPEGGYFHSTNATVTGAIKIELPTATYGKNDMISFDVTVFDYAGGDGEGESFKATVSGYPYETGGAESWNNTNVTLHTSSDNKDYNYRMAYQDNVRHIVYIGEVGSTWAYPQVIISNVTAGFSANMDNWDSGWAISFDTNITSPELVDHTVSGNYPTAGRGKAGTNFSVGALTSDGQITSSGNEVEISGTSPRVDFVETAGTNNWNILVDADNLDIRRSGTSNTEIRLDGSRMYNFYGGEAQRNVGSSTGIANTAYISFYESNNSTRKGYVGDGSASNNDIFLASDAGGIQFVESGTSYDLAGASAARWSNVPVVTSGGVWEAGRYIDFHTTNGATSDFNVRLDATGDSNLRMTGPGTGDQFEVYQSSVEYSKMGANTSGGYLQASDDGGGTVTTIRGYADSDFKYGIDVEVATASTTKDTGAIVIEAGGLGVEGEIHAGGDITAFASSDPRLKDNIKPIKNALEKVNKITGYSYDWKPFVEDMNGKKGHDYGVLTTEVSKIMPEIVRESTHGYDQVEYTKLIPLLLQAVKEQNDIINDQERRLREMEKKFSKLEKALR